MLIKCPECNHDVSDTATTCPNCGYSIKENIEEIQTNAKAQEEKAAAEKVAQEQKAAENKRQFRKWIIRGILIAIAVFIVVLIGESIYVSKYENYIEVMKFVEEFKKSDREYNQTVGLIVCDTITVPDYKEFDDEIVHINYETKSDIAEDAHFPIDYYFMKSGHDTFIYSFAYSPQYYNLYFLGTEESAYINSPNYYYDTAKKAYKEYNSGEKSEEFNYSETIKLNDYNLLISKITLLFNNSKQMK